LLEMPLRTRSYNGLTQIWDPIRKIWVVLSPEEHVRQALLYFLHHKMGYPMGLTAVERGIDLGHTTLRFDAVIFLLLLVADFLVSALLLVVGAFVLATLAVGAFVLATLAVGAFVLATLAVGAFILTVGAFVLATLAVFFGIFA